MGDAEASLRAELAERLSQAQADLEATLVHHRQGGHGLAVVEGQLQGLATLKQRVAFADPRQLAGLRNEVIAVAAATQLVALQSPAATENADTPSAKARRAVLGLVDDYYEKKIFDPYLQFASEEDEKAYRAREAARKAAIDAAIAEGTPAGTLKATRLMQDQLRDAGAHGAARSPDFAQRAALLDEAATTLEATTTAQRPVNAEPVTDPLAALRAAGVTVADGSAPATVPGTGQPRGRG